MPQPFSSTNLGIPLKPILDPLARSDVSIGQSPYILVRATPELSVERPFGDRLGAHARATVIQAGFWRAELLMEMVLEGWELILGCHSSICRETFAVGRCVSKLGQRPNSACDVGLPLELTSGLGRDRGESGGLRGVLVAPARHREKLGCLFMGIVGSGCARSRIVGLGLIGSERWISRGLEGSQCRIVRPGEDLWSLGQLRHWADQIRRG